MDDRDDALIKMAVDALCVVRRNTKNARHRDLWDLAISRVNQTRRDVVSDDDIAAIRRAPRDAAS